MHITILPAYMYHENAMPTVVLRRHQDPLKLYGCEPLCGCWEPSPGPLQGRQTLLTVKPSLQSHLVRLLIKARMETKSKGPRSSFFPSL